MSVLGRIKAAVSALKGKGDFPDVAEHYHDFPWPTDWLTLEFPQAVQLVPTVYACVTRISNDVASLPLRFYTGKGEEREPMERAMGNPAEVWEAANPEATGYELARDLQFSLDISGTSYLYLERFGRKAPPGELWVMPGHLVTPVPGPRRSVRYYEWGAQGLAQRIETENVIPFRYSNPNADPLEPAPLGLSPLRAAQYAYEARFNMTGWHRKLYERGAQVAHVFNLKDGIAATDQQVRAMQDAYEKRFQGVKNAWRPAFVKGVELLKTGLTPAEMQFMETAKMTDADICRVFGIPPVLMGIKEGGGLSDAGATSDLLLYWQNCILPRVRLRDAILNERLCPLYGKGITCETDLSGVYALQSEKLEQAKSLVILTGRPILTVNEARIKMGEPETDEETADELVVPSTAKLAEDLLLPEPAPAVPPSAAPSQGESESGSAPEQPSDEGTAPPPRETEAGLRRRFGLDVNELKRRRADADLARYERRVAREFAQRFSRQEERTVEALKVQARTMGVQVKRFAYDPDALFEDDDEDRDQLQAIFEQLVRERGEAAAAEIGVELAVDVSKARLAQLIRGQVDRMITLTDETTRKELRESIAQGISAGESFSALVDRVRAAFDGRRRNAMTIARTETAWAYNAAAVESWRMAGVTMKSWLTVGDDAVRETHTGCESEGSIPMDQVFSNGCMYPGDPMGDASEVINCRCVLQPEGLDEGFRRIFRAARKTDEPSKNGRSRLQHVFAVSR